MQEKGREKKKKKAKKKKKDSTDHFIYPHIQCICGLNDVCLANESRQKRRFRDVARTRSSETLSASALRVEKRSVFREIFGPQVTETGLQAVQLFFREQRGASLGAGRCG